jgi:hypothetical protein
MDVNTLVLQGILRADGVLELPGPVELPPGPVEVTLRVLAQPEGEDLATFLARIRAEQQARGYKSPTREEIDADIRQMRDEWEEHQLGIEKLQEECQRSKENTSATEQPE